MIKTITVTGSEDPPVTYYKTTNPVPTGQYYHITGRIDTTLRRKLGCIAASQGNRFLNLAPPEPWVHRLLTGSLRPKPINPPPAPDGFFTQCPINLREWQNRFLAHVHYELAATGRFRRGVVVGLGGGKTLAGLTVAQAAESPLVLAPRYLHSTWIGEAKKFGMVPPRLSTYESAHKCGPTDCLIIDEILCAKCPTAARTQAMQALARDAEVVIGFTGTPTGGKGPMDWRWLRVIEPGCVPASDSPWRFLFGLDTELVEVKPGTKAWVTTQWNADLVAQFVAPFTFCVDTADLTADLPEVQYQTITVPQPRDYSFVLKGAATTTTSSKRVAQCRQCTDGFVLKDDGTPIDLADQPKLDAVQTWVEGLGEPVVVYAAWDHSIDLLAERLRGFNPAVIRGSTSDLGAQIDRFVNGSTPVLIANARFSQGMNLQERCRLMAFVSVSPSPTDFSQGVGRIFRPGQKRGCVVTSFQCESTIDVRAYELVSRHIELSKEQVEALLEKELDI